MPRTAGRTASSTFPRRRALASNRRIRPRRSPRWSGAGRDSPRSRRSLGRLRAACADRGRARARSRRRRSSRSLRDTRSAPPGPLSPAKRSPRTPGKGRARSRRSFPLRDRETALRGSPSVPRHLHSARTREPRCRPRRRGASHAAFGAALHTGDRRASSIVRRTAKGHGSPQGCGDGTTIRPGATAEAGSPPFDPSWVWQMLQSPFIGL